MRQTLFLWPSCLILYFIHVATSGLIQCKFTKTNHITIERNELMSNNANSHLLMTRIKRKIIEMVSKLSHATNRNTFSFFLCLKKIRKLIPNEITKFRTIFFYRTFNPQFSLCVYFLNREYKEQEYLHKITKNAFFIGFHDQWSTQDVHL
jgi:hypothetical protein